VTALPCQSQLICLRPARNMHHVHPFRSVGANATRRFACAFTLGSGLIMASFFALKGFRTQATHMLDKDRLLFSMGACMWHWCSQVKNTTAM